VPQQQVGVARGAVDIGGQRVQPDDVGGEGRRRLPRARGRVGQRPGQEVDAEVDPLAGGDELLDLGVGLGAGELGLELGDHELGDRHPQGAGQLARHNLGHQRPRPLPRAAELHHVHPVVVGLDQPRQRAALAQGHHVAGGGHGPQRAVGID
jgi:hypothetical protein